MGYGPSGPNYIKALDLGGAAQFAQGLTDVIKTMNQEREFTQGQEEFQNILKRHTDEQSGDVDYEKVQREVLSSRNIKQTQAKGISERVAELQKSKQEGKKAREEYEKQLTQQASSRKLGELIEKVNRGDITPEQAAAETATLPDKDIRSQGFSEFGRRTDRETRIKGAEAAERLKQNIKDYADLRQDVFENADDARNSLRGVELGEASIEGGGTGPTSQAAVSDFLEGTDSHFLKTVGKLLRTKQGQSLKESQLQTLQSTLRPTFGARPAVVEFETVMSKLIATGVPEEVNRVSLQVQRLKAETDLQMANALEIIDNERLDGITTEAEAIKKYREVQKIIQKAKEKDLKAITNSIKK